MNKKAFTLIELLVVISIIALLSSVVLASLNTARDKAKTAASKEMNSSMFRAMADSLLVGLDFDECSGTAIADGSALPGNPSVFNSPTPTASTYSGLGCALTFNGTSQYIALPNSVSYSPTSFAASAWFKTTTSGDRKIISSNTTSHPIQVFSNALRVCINGLCAVGSANIADNAWHFVAVVGNGSTVKAYLDGQSNPDITMAPVGTTVVGAQTVAAATGPADYFPGSLDEVRLYSRNLTASEVQGLYAQGLAAHPVAAR